MVDPRTPEGERIGMSRYCDCLEARIAELEARLEAVVSGAILPADAVDEFTVDGVRWVRVPAEATVRFERRQHAAEVYGGGRE